MSLENQLAFGPGWPETTETRDVEHVDEGGQEEREGPAEQCPPHVCGAETVRYAGGGQPKGAPFSQRG